MQYKHLQQQQQQQSLNPKFWNQLWILKRLVRDSYEDKPLNNDHIAKQKLKVDVNLYRSFNTQHIQEKGINHRFIGIMTQIFKNIVREQRKKNSMQEKWKKELPRL